MSPRTPEQLQVLRTQRQASIMDAALHVFAEEHYHNASIGQIAKRAGISKGLIYNYFESKEALLVALMLNMFDELSTEFGIHENSEVSRELVLHWLNKSFEVVLRDKQHWKLYFSLIMQQEVQELVMDKMMERAGPYVRLLHDWFVMSGHPNPVARMRYFTAVVDGIQMHLILDPIAFPIEEVKTMIINEFLPE